MIRLYNSMSRNVEDFSPIDRHRVTMYACGPTVYDTPHIGNVRPAIVYDVLRRLLEWEYGDAFVQYARNLTDIDDKIIDRANERGITIKKLTQETVRDYHRAMRLLNVAHPSYEPRATETIPTMRKMIQTLIDKGHAYVKDGHVLFRVASFANHGCLSRHDQNDLRATGRVIHGDYKEAEADFVLWKPSTESQPGWESPWGFGRPGWHIECSAMIKKYLGETIDIHAGGADLRFPHHDCEISQSECANGAPLARYWLHNGMLLVNGKKMSKSNGNFITVDDLLHRGVKPDAIRLVMLQTHYRQPLNWTNQALENAQIVLDKWRDALVPHRDHFSFDYGYDDDPVVASLMDDMNTPAAISEIHKLSSEINRTGDSVAVHNMKRGLVIMGLMKGVFTDSLSHHSRAMILYREKLRADGEYDMADTVRKTLLDEGVAIKDTPKGTVWWTI